MNIFATIIGSLFEMYTGYMFLSKFGNIKVSRKIYLVYFTLLTIFLIIASATLVESGLIFFAFALCFLLHSLLFKIKRLKKILCSLALIITVALSEMIVVMATTVGLNTDVVEIQTNGILYFICIILSKFLGFAILKPINLKQISVQKKFPIWFTIATAILPFTSIFIIVLLYRYCYLINTISYQISTVAAAVLLIVSNLLVLFVIDKQEKFYVTKERLAFAEIHIKEQRTHYAELYSQQEALKKYRHDSKNFYVSLISILENKSTEEAISYIKDKMSIISNNSNLINSGNPVVDSIIYSKKQICDNKDIILKTSLKISETIKIDELEFGVLIGNALDNAIEATEELADSNRKIINLTILTSGEMISIEISNPTIKDIDTTNIETSKTDKAQHGYGLKGIETITNKYNGNLSLSCENNIFTLSAILVNL